MTTIVVDELPYALSNALLLELRNQSGWVLGYTRVAIGVSHWQDLLMTETSTTRMKVSPDTVNEVHPASDHKDPQSNCLTPVIQFPPEVAKVIVEAIAGLVRAAHEAERVAPTPSGNLIRAQEFEEGDVYMLEAPFEGFFADRYLMDFYDVRQRDLCSRMHLHTGLRFVRMMTGPDTAIRVSSLSEFLVTPSIGWRGGQLNLFADIDPADETSTRRRYNAIVPPNSWVDMQIPRGVSHQFNADGPYAVIDSVHPEESIEVLREEMSGYRMMAQTIFLNETRGPATDCYLND